MPVCPAFRLRRRPPKPRQTVSPWRNSKLLIPAPAIRRRAPRQGYASNGPEFVGGQTNPQTGGIIPASQTLADVAPAPRTPTTQLGNINPPSNIAGVGPAAMSAARLVDHWERHRRGCGRRRGYRLDRKEPDFDARSTARLWWRLGGFGNCKQLRLNVSRALRELVRGAECGFGYDSSDERCWLIGGRRARLGCWCRSRDRRHWRAHRRTGQGLPPTSGGIGDRRGSWLRDRRLYRRTD